MFYRPILGLLYVLISELQLAEPKYKELYRPDKSAWGAADLYHPVFIWLAWIIYASLRSLIAEETQAQKDKLDEHILQLGKDHLDQINALKVEHEKQISWEKEKHEDSLSNYRQLCKWIQYHVYCIVTRPWCLLYKAKRKKMF